MYGIYLTRFLSVARTPHTKYNSSLFAVVVVVVVIVVVVVVIIIVVVVAFDAAVVVALAVGKVPTSSYSDQHCRI